MSQRRNKFSVPAPHHHATGESAAASCLYLCSKLLTTFSSSFELKDLIMEAAITTLVSQFKVFAGKDGSTSTLSKDEFQNLLTSQLPSYAKVLDWTVGTETLLEIKQNLKNMVVGDLWDMNDSFNFES